MHVFSFWTPLVTCVCFSVSSTSTLQRCRGTQFCPTCLYLPLIPPQCCSSECFLGDQKYQLHCTVFLFLVNQNQRMVYTSLNVAIKSEVHKWEASFSNTVTRRLRNGENDSVIKSNDCSSRGQGFKSQQPHGGSQLSLIPDSSPRNPIISSSLRTHTRTHTHTIHSQICRQNTHKH